MCPSVYVIYTLRCACHACIREYMLCTRSINIHSAYNRFQLCRFPGHAQLTNCIILQVYLASYTPMLIIFPFFSFFLTTTGTTLLEKIVYKAFVSTVIALTRCSELLDELRFYSWIDRKLLGPLCLQPESVCCRGHFYNFLELLPNQRCLADSCASQRCVTKKETIIFHMSLWVI